MNIKLLSTIALTVLIASAGAAGAWYTAPVGSAGPNGAFSGCPNNERMSGFNGRAGALIDQLQGVCEGGSTLAVRGGSGGSAVNVMCPGGKYLYGVQSYMDTYFINGMRSQCWGSNSIGYSGWVGNPSGATYVGLDCAPDWAKGYYIESGDLVDRLWLWCAP